ncbi:hypothetical protein [Enterococcus sp. AZ007]|uniref:hypothetical protein n=1 Tax=Enterococcus sp. AZ007 TaxID=2774839 RepID=UPI003F202BD1
MRQRLGIGIAILNRPDFLILDEPINGLDPQGIIEVREIIQRLNREWGTTILISSHILSELSMVATRYGFLHEGKLLKEFSVNELNYGQRILLQTQDNEKAKEILEEHQIISRREENLLLVEQKKNSMPMISKLLFEHGLYLITSHFQEESLEDYFIQLTGGTSK